MELALRRGFCLSNEPLTVYEVVLQNSKVLKLILIRLKINVRIKYNRVPFEYSIVEWTVKISEELCEYKLNDALY